MGSSEKENYATLAKKLKRADLEAGVELEFKVRLAYSSKKKKVRLA
jgi:hypothetical protein